MRIASARRRRAQHRQTWRIVLSLCLGCAPGLVLAAQSVREQEIAECRPGEISTWEGAKDRPAISSSMRFVYSHAGSPAWFSEEAVLAAVQLAAQAWSACGVPAAVLSAATSSATDAVAVQWSEAGSRGNFGLANLGRRTLSLGPAAFALLQNRNPGYDARQTLQMVISHEMGHLFGLVAHSRRCVDVTSYYDDGNGAKCFSREPAQMKAFTEYRSALPTACDIQRCRAANANPPLSLLR